MTTRSSIFSRKLDLVYVVWFVLHFAIMFAVDLVPLYPAFICPQALLELRQWYITTYHDRFFTNPPAWFTAYAWMEAVYHVPLSLWAIQALINDDPRVPVQLLIWAVQTAVTTGTCIVDFMSWKGLSADETIGLLGLYAPYCVLSLLIGADMMLRLQDSLQPAMKSKQP